MSERYLFWLRFTLFAVILCGIVLVLNMFFGSYINTWRWDLTRNKNYTISPASKKILSSLKVPVRIEYYVSPTDKMPAEWKDLQTQVTDKLKEIASASNGKMTINVLNPTIDDEWKKRLQDKGISPFAVKAYEKDQISSKIIFSSLLISYKEKKDEIISQVIPSTFNNLEYEILSRVAKMISDEKPKVALYAPLEQMEPWMAQMYMQMGRQPPGPKDNYQTVLKVLQEQNYEVQKFSFTKEDPLPKDASTLIIMHPDSLSDRQLYEIGKFLSKGGSVIMAVQIYNYKLRGSPDGGIFIETNEIKPNLEPLLTSFGVTIKDKILCDSSILPMSMPLSGEQAVPVKLPHQIMVTEKTISKDTPITQNVYNMLYIWGNAINLDEAKINSLGLKPTIIFTTTDEAYFAKFTKGEMKTSDFKPVDNKKSTQLCGVLLSGKFPDIYKDKKEPDWQQSREGPPRYPPRIGKEPKLDPSKARLVIFGSSRMFEDDLIGSQMALQYFQNIFLFVNAVDVLTTGEDLISIRGKTILPTRFQAPSRNEMLFWRILVMAGIPLLFIIFGIIKVAIINKRFKAGTLKDTSFFRFITGKSAKEESTKAGEGDE